MKARDILAEAQRRANSTDFGEDSFREPLERLVDSVDRESQLTEFGGAAFPELLIGGLVNRLKIEEWYKRHPEIDEGEIVAPVFGVGLPRTGSTLTGHLMSLDSDTRSLRQWEVEDPCPPPIPGKVTDPRIQESEDRHDQFVAMCPEVPPTSSRSVLP